MKIADRKRDGAAESKTTPVLRFPSAFLGGSCNEFVKNAMTVSNTANSSSSVMDSFAQQDLWQSARDLSEKVSTVMAVLQEGSRGTQV